MALEMLPIEMSAIIVIVPIVLVGLIVYLIYKFGIREKSFEEVIEEQKRHSIEEEQKQKSEKVKKEKKFKKTWGKKSKEKHESEISSEATPIVEMKDVATGIEIIEPKEIKPMKQNKKAKTNANQSHETSLLQEKIKKQEILTQQEKIKKTEITSVPEKSIQEKKIEVEKSEVEQKVEVEVKETTSPPIIIPPQKVSTVQGTSQPSTTAQRKKKKEQIEKDDTIFLTTGKILSFIKQAGLEAEEIQNLIDALLNKQKDTVSWQKVHDPIALTKKNLQEKTQLLDLEQQQHQAVTSKLKDLREEYNGFKTKATAQEKSNQEKVNRLMQEIQNLTMRLKQVQDQLKIEKEKFDKVAKDMETQNQASVKSLEDEKAKLLQKISKLEDQSRSGVSLTEYETLKKSREDLQKVHMLVVEQHTQLVTTHKNDIKNLQSQLSNYKAEVEKLNEQNVVLSNEIQALNDSKSSAESARNAAEDKLKVEEKQFAELEAQMKQLIVKTNEITDLQAKLKEFESENERLTEQLVTTKERVAGDGQEIVHHNGEVNGKSQVPEKSYEDKDKLLEEKELLLAQLTDDLNKQKTKISKLNEEIEVQKQKNNELREKNWKAMEAVTNAEKNAEQQIKEIQSNADLKIAQLQKSYEVQQHTTTNDLQLTEQLKKAENEASQNILNYNKEIEKNRHLSCEINKATEQHKCSQQKLSEMEKDIQELKSDYINSQSRTKESLQRICPSVSIDSSLPFEKWLLEFEQQSMSYIQLLVSQNSISQVCIDELLQEKEKEYQQKLKNYVEALAETESTLLKLQESAESQDILWQERLKNKMQELQEVQSEKDALIAEKEAMQSTLQQLSQLEELQEKLKLLQNTIETAERDRSHLEQKFDEVNKNYINLQNQLTDKEKQIVELRNESNTSKHLNKEIEELKSKLEKEQKINKDFSSQMVRLHSLVKIGQDSLKVEQEAVASLKQQLSIAKVSTANGTTSATKTNPVTNNESQPKTKHSGKSKKKMDASDNK